MQPNKCSCDEWGVDDDLDNGLGNETIPKYIKCGSACSNPVGGVVDHLAGRAARNSLLHPKFYTSYKFVFSLLTVSSGGHWWGLGGCSLTCFSTQPPI